MRNYYDLVAQLLTGNQAGQSPGQPGAEVDPYADATNYMQMLRRVGTGLGPMGAGYDSQRAFIGPRTFGVFGESTPIDPSQVLDSRGWPSAPLFYDPIGDFSNYNDWVHTIGSFGVADPRQLPWSSVPPWFVNNAGVYAPPNYPPAYERPSGPEYGPGGSGRHTPGRY